MLRLFSTAVVLLALACGRDNEPTAPTTASLNGSATQMAADDDDDDGGDRRPEGDDVEASVIFTHIDGKSRECDGKDGHYFENHVTLTGSSTGDPRLTGKIEVRLHELFNVAELIGPQWGSVVIRDAATGRKKAEGDFSNWGPADMGQGTIVGVVKDDGAGGEPTSGDGRWIANWRITYGSGITAQIGGETTDGRLPAGVWKGRCTGKYTEVDVDLPGSAATSAGSGGSWRAPRL
jgi:hypothetical protein